MEADNAQPLDVTRQAAQAPIEDVQNNTFWRGKIGPSYD